MLFLLKWYFGLTQFGDINLFVVWFMCIITYHNGASLVFENTAYLPQWGLISV